MQKKFIALAVAGLVSGAAFAQSNVTVYGVVDTSFENSSATGATNSAANVSGVSLSQRNRVASNSSYIGFKGTEALGNGLSAVFQIETQFASDNAQNATAGTTANTLANRDSFVGLTGGFGTAIAGYLSTPHRSVMAAYDVMPGATGPAGSNGMIGRINVGASQVAGVTTNTLAAANNANAIFRSQAVAYVTPTFGGFSGVVAYVPNENKAQDQTQVAQTNQSGWNYNVNYANGPLKAAYSYIIVQDPVAGVIGSRLKSHLLAGGYTFGGATTVNLMFNQNTVDLDTAASANQIKNNVWYLGVKHVMGQHEFAGMYAIANDGSVTNAGVGTDTTTDRGANQLGLRYAYNLSKRTQAYALWTRITNKSNGNYDFGAGNAVNNSNTATGAFGVGAGADPQAFGVGVRHSF